jgi:shikimate kinase
MKRRLRSVVTWLDHRTGIEPRLANSYTKTSLPQAAGIRSSAAWRFFSSSSRCSLGYYSRSTMLPLRAKHTTVYVTFSRE